MNKSKELIKNFVEMVLVVVITYVVFTYIIKPIRIEGSSMMSTVANQDMALVDAIGLKMNGVERFDVVLVESNRLNETLIKRVIGLPNETIEYREDCLYVNGVYVEENFLDDIFMNESKQMYNTTYFTNDFKIKLGEGEYFVLGDNRLNSKDSRMLGSFKITEFIGKNGFVIYPFDHFGWINKQ